MRKIVLLLGLILFAHAANAGGFADKLTALDHADKGVFKTGVELYKKDFAGASDAERSQGYLDLTNWVQRGMNEKSFSFLPDPNEDNDGSGSNYYALKEKIKKEYDGVINVNSAEGYNYYEPDFIALGKMLGEMLPGDVKAYNAIRDAESQTPILRDAAIVIEFAEYPARLKAYQEFLEKYPDSPYAKDLEGDYRRFAGFLLTGIDNNPVCNEYFPPDEKQMQAIEELGRQDARYAGLASDMVRAFKTKKKCEQNRFEGVDYDKYKI